MQAQVYRRRRKAREPLPDTTPKMAAIRGGGNIRYRDCNIGLFEFRFTIKRQLLKRTVKLRILRHILPREKDITQDHPPRASGGPSKYNTFASFLGNY